MDHSATQPHMGEVEGASSMFGMLGENNVGEHFGSRRSTVRTQNAHQSIVAQTVHSNEGINFASSASSDTRGADGMNQTINGEHVEIGGNVTYGTSLVRPSLPAAEPHTHRKVVTEKRTIAEWLSSSSPLRFEEKQRDTIQIARRAPGAGQWLLNHEKFKFWREGETKRLLCSGNLGAGKTVLASIIVEALRNECKSSDAACVCIYFDHEDRKRQVLQNLASSILTQLVQDRHEVSDVVKKAHKLWLQKGMQPSTSEYISMLKVEVKSYSRVYLIVDALDECSEDPRSNTRDSFLRLLCQLPSNVQVLFTSRPQTNLHKEVEVDEEQVIHIAADEKDLRSYIENRINSRGPMRALVKQGNVHNEKFLENLVGTVVKRSKGMFLLTQIHVDSLMSKITLKGLQEGIKTLPQSIDAVYEASLKRIQAQDPSRYKLAISALGWLVFAERPLTISELQHAVAVHPGDRDLVESGFASEENLTASCAGLVVVDAGTRIARLAHYTAEAYLRKNTSRFFDNFQSVMAEICLTYLSFTPFGKAIVPTRAIADRRQKYPLLSYAADHWGDHLFFGASGQVYRLAAQFFDDPFKVKSAFQVMSDTRFSYEENVSPLHLAAYFGLDNLAKKLILKNYSMNTCTRQGETAVHWAAFYGQNGTLKVLVENGADLNVRDQSGATALHMAVMNEDVVSVQILLSAANRVDVNLIEGQGWTSLRWAAAYGKYKITEILLKNRAEIDGSDKDGWTALRWAAQRGHRKIVELLIRSGAMLQEANSDGWTLLHWAAKEGKMPMIRLLIDEKVDLNIVDAEGKTALRGAADYGRGMIAWLLIESGAIVDKPDRKGQTPLHAAVDLWQTSRDKSLVWLLVEAGANINARTKHGITALHIAARKGGTSLIWLLLEKGAKVGEVDNLGQTALHWATKELHEETAKILLERAPKLIQAVNTEGGSSLHEAASLGSLPMVILLLEKGSDIDAQDRSRSTPLHKAAMQQHKEVVYYLICQGANVNAKNRKKSTALHEAAATGNWAIVKILSDSPEVDTTLKNADGRTAWEVSQEWGHKFDRF